MNGQHRGIATLKADWRVCLTRTVNADSSWLLQLPIPSPSHTNGTATHRRWFNILLDPWLSGPQSDVVSWFSTQWHAIAPHYPSIADVLRLCGRVDALSLSQSVSSTDAPSAPESDGQGEDDGRIDLVVISHEFTDHCHRETLLGLPPSTPVWATTKAVGVVRGYKHFEHVVEVPPFAGGDWRALARDSGAEKGKEGAKSVSERGGPPDFLRVARVVEGKDALYYHSGIVIIFDLSPGASPAAAPAPAASASASYPEYLLYTPHGLRPASLPPLLPPLADPALHPLLMLHGLHDVRIDFSLQLNLGAHNGLAAQRALGARYWVGTHDEVKKGGGVVAWFLRRKRWVLGDALEQEKEKEVAGNGNGKGAEGDGARYLELGNGEVLLLA